MNAFDGLRLDLAGQPLMIKVIDAARLLGIGRTLAYRLAGQFENGDRTGLPVVRIGGCLRVPRWALVEWVLHGRVESDLGHEVDHLVDELAGVEASAPANTPVALPIDESGEPQQLGLGF